MLALLLSTQQYFVCEITSAIRIYVCRVRRARTISFAFERFGRRKPEDGNGRERKEILVFRRTCKSMKSSSMFYELNNFAMTWGNCAFYRSIHEYIIWTTCSAIVFWLYSMQRFEFQMLSMYILCGGLWM